MSAAVAAASAMASSKAVAPLDRISEGGAQASSLSMPLQQLGCRFDAHQSMPLPVPASAHSGVHGAHAQHPVSHQLPSQPLPAYNSSSGMRQPLPKSPYMTHATPASGPYAPQLLMPMSSGPSGHWGSPTAAQAPHVSSSNTIMAPRSL
jgi:hypothetical protein